MLKQKSLILVIIILSLMLVMSGCNSPVNDNGNEHTFKEITSDITEDTTFSSDVTYTVTDNINVEAELTIEPGTIIKFEQGAGLNLPSTEGAIVAEGTEDDKILFTGTEASPGWWDGIWMKNSTNSNNKLDHVIVEYGGNDNVHRYSEPGNVIVGSSASADSASIDITNSKLSHSKNHGLYVKSGGSLTGFSDNTLTNNDGPVHIKSTQVHNLDIGSSYIGNEDDIVYVDGSYDLTSDNLDSENVTWENLGLPYRINYDDQMIIGDINMTINPGVEIKFEAGGGLRLTSQGALIAEGTADNKILFTATDTQRGWWDGIWIKDSTNQNNILNHVIVEYGGNDNVHKYSEPGNVIVGSGASLDSSSINITNSTLRDSGSYGLRVFSDGEVNDDWETINEFENNNDGKSNLN